MKTDGEELDMKIIKDNAISYNFSNFFNKMNLAILLDNYRKYGIINDNLRRLYATYLDLPYNTYNNVFTGLDNFNDFINIFNRNQQTFQNMRALFGLVQFKD